MTSMRSAWSQAGRILLRPMPVLYACAGCREFGYAAPRVAQALDDRGLAEAIWLGSAPPRVTGRYPIFTLDACGNSCAREWVRERGAGVQRAFVLDPGERDNPEAATARIAAEFSSTGGVQAQRTLARPTE